MSASMAEVLAQHRFMYGKSVSATFGRVEVCACGWETMPTTHAKAWEAFAAHQAEVLAANGCGKLEDAWDACNATDTPWINPYRRPE